jgi:hypothetical protein
MGAEMEWQRAKIIGQQKMLVVEIDERDPVAPGRSRGTAGS